MGMLRKIGGWVFNRWVVTILGLLLLFLLIWFVGPLIAFAGWEPLGSEDARWAVILLILAVWLAKTVIGIVKARKTNADMLDGFEASDFAQLPLDGGDITDGSLTGDDIQDGSLGSADLGPDSVGSSELVANSVGSGTGTPP